MNREDHVSGAPVGEEDVLGLNGRYLGEVEAADRALVGDFIPIVSSAA